MMKVLLNGLLGMVLMALAGFGHGADSVWDQPTAALATDQEILVYRSPTCGCCGKWLEHLQKHQFKVKDVLINDMQAIKAKYGIPARLASCHTAVVDGYLIEGHVPAADIKKLLREKPAIAGLSVPGMPSGTPGMEMGGKKDPFAVIAFDRDGNDRTFSEYLSY